VRLLGSFFGVGVVAVAPESRRERFKFYAEFVGTSAIWASGPDDTASDFEACFRVLNAELATCGKVNGRKNQSAMKINHRRQSRLWLTTRLNLDGNGRQDTAASSLISHVIHTLKHKSIFALRERTGPGPNPTRAFKIEIANL
jgi:hypothetical protein